MMPSYNFYYAIIVILSAILFQDATAKDCSKPCPKCPSSLKCALGVSIIPDECGCCKTCAKQLYQSCDAANPCDHHKNLYCSFGDVDDSTGVCVAKPGRSCFLDGKVYLNGESLSPSCKVHCTCIDSDFGCTPQCPVSAPIPRDCDHPRLVKKPGKCCEEWICIKTNRKSEMPRIRNQIKHNESRRNGHTSRPSVFNFAAAKRRPEVALTVRGKCMIQTTQWSACSKSCGWGVSERVTNNNKACKLTKETRLCQIRPCDVDFEANIKKGKKCLRSPKATRPVRYSFSGCKTKVHTPKYCGQCVDGRCCTPARTKTVTATFHCDDGFSFKKRMMQIKSCSCHRKCGQSDNDILKSYQQLSMHGKA